MKYIKLFENYNKEDIDSICRKYGIKNYTINSDGSIDVNGDVWLDEKNLTKLPLKFNKVNGWFDCSVNRLTSLDGCPKEVIGSFYCYDNNNITSLIGCPERVGGNFDCRGNNIRDFEGFPKHIGGGFYCGGSPVYKVWRLFKDKDKIELFNDYDIIRDDVIIMDRLNDFLIEIGKPTVTEVKGYKCI